MPLRQELTVYRRADMDQGHPWDIVKCRERTPSFCGAPQENVTKAYSAPVPGRALQAEGTVWTQTRRGAVWWEDGGRRFRRNRSRGDGFLEAQGGLCPRGSVSSLREEPLEETTCSVALSPGHVYAQHAEPLSRLRSLVSHSEILFLEFTTLTPLECTGNWRLVLKRAFRFSN